MNSKNLGTAAILLSLPAIWAAGATFGMDHGADLPAFAEWCLVVNVVFTVSASVLVMWRLILMLTGDVQ